MNIKNHKEVVSTPLIGSFPRCVPAMSGPCAYRDGVTSSCQGSEAGHHMATASLVLCTLLLHRAGQLSVGHRGRHGACQAVRVNNHPTQNGDKMRQSLLRFALKAAEIKLLTAQCNTRCWHPAPSLQCSKLSKSDSAPASLQFIYPQPA